jgi:hypothetical protein
MQARDTECISPDNNPCPTEVLHAGERSLAVTLALRSCTERDEIRPRLIRRPYRLATRLSPADRNCAPAPAECCSWRIVWQTARGEDGCPARVSSPGRVFKPTLGPRAADAQFDDLALKPPAKVDWIAGLCLVIRILLHGHAPRSPLMPSGLLWHRRVWSARPSSSIPYLPYSRPMPA